MGVCDRSSMASFDKLYAKRICHATPVIPCQISRFFAHRRGFVVYVFDAATVRLRRTEKTMPRIAASIGVIALIVFSVGFNISRYPIVWDTSDASSHLLSSAESLQVKTASDSAKLPLAEDSMQQDAKQELADEQPHYAAAPIPYEPVPYEQPVPYEPLPHEPIPYARYTPPAEPSYRSLEPSGTAVEPNGPDTSYDLAASAPQVAESSAKYGADAEPSTAVISELPARRMVPIVFPQAAQPASDLTARSRSPSPSESSESVRRLPSVDEVNAVPDDHQTVQLPMTPIPIYPTTGF